MNKTHITITLEKNKLVHVHKLIFVNEDSFIVESFNDKNQLVPDLHLPLIKLEDAIDTFLLQIINDDLFHKWKEFKSNIYIIPRQQNLQCMNLIR